MAIRKTKTKRVATRKPSPTRKSGRAGKKVSARRPIRKRAKKPARRSPSRKVSVVQRKTRQRVRRTARTTRKAAKAVIPRPRGLKELVFLETFVASPLRARLLRLFFRNPLIAHELKEVSSLIGMPLPKVRREAKLLKEIGVITLISRRGKSHVQVSTTFPFIAEVQRVVTGSFPIGRDELLKLVKPAGKLKLVVVSGLFLNEPKARVDLLVVADRYSEKRLEKAIKKVEQVVASEVRWAGMDVKEFKYRYKMYDRFVRDIVSHAHERILEQVKF